MSKRGNAALDLACGLLFVAVLLIGMWCLLEFTSRVPYTTPLARP